MNYVSSMINVNYMTYVGYMSYIGYMSELYQYLMNRLNSFKIT